MGRLHAASSKISTYHRRLSRKQLLRISRQEKQRINLAKADTRVAPHPQFAEDPKSNGDPQPERNPPAKSDIEIHLQDQVQQDPEINHSNPENISDNDVQEVRIEGRRIVDISYMLDQIHAKFDNHNPPLDCSFRNIVQTKSRQYGLQTQIFFQCRVCKFEDSVWSDRNGDDTMTINRCAVAGTMAAGIGYSQFQELLASMNIPCTSLATYRKNDMDMVAAFEMASQKEMQQAGENAKKLAFERGDFIVHEGEKIPFITVVADCAWMKRSYKTGKYDSLSGVGSIVDYHTGKVIFIGVRNKFCSVCEWATRHHVTSKPHVCFKNWGRDQASTGMEADALLDGFKTSMEMHGLIYKTLIADGDSNVYKSILDNDPYGKYGVIVEKKECINHMYRCMIRKIKDVAKMKGRNISQLKKLVENSGMKFKESIEMAIVHRRNNSAGQYPIDLLKSDVLNMPYHVFGNHRTCNRLQGFCVQQTTDEDIILVDGLRRVGLLQQLEDAVTRVACHSDSLLYHANNNAAEAFNSIVCKLIGGKRINFGLRGSFQGRCAGSVVQYNTQNILTKLHASSGKVPPTTITSLEVRRQRKVANNSLIRQKRKALRSQSTEKNKKQQGRDKNYGPNAEKPDLPDCMHDDLVIVHRRRLLEQQKNRTDIEKSTRGQADNGLWRSARSKMLTASNFGKVCRMYDSTLCSATVKSILYPPVRSTSAMVWGQTNESKAIEALQNKLAEEGNRVTIRPCGLFIDRDVAFLGASPDGIIDDTSIVELKCPKSARDYDPEDAIRQRVTTIHKYFDVKNTNKMNKSHHYYYQVQGQLHITQSEVCCFTVWTRLGLKYIKVPRDFVDISLSIVINLKSQLKKSLAQ